MKTLIIYNNKSWIVTDSNSAWEYENDHDWFMSIPLSSIEQEEKQEALMTK